MAEVAGVAVGVLALIGSFRDCIDLFSCFVAARSLGRDYEILSANLDIEKALLLQWADRTNLLKPHYDKRLDDPDVRAIVARIMSNIELLLGDSQVLQQRYGLHAMKDRGSNSMFSSLSQKRMFSLTKEFGKLDFIMKEFEKLDLRIDGYRSTSYKSKARWAIRDKNKFGELLQELSFFVSKLNDLVPDSSRAIHKMTAEDLSTLRSMETLRLVSEAASGRRSHVMDMAEDSLVRNCEQRILRCIWFRLMDDRRDSLPLPNPKTFEWAIEQSDASLKWDDLPDWLEGGTGLYWVCGKAGSGKSTLMKYISSACRTQLLLNRWAGSTPLTIANFFFWYLGSPEQKSQEGLSRALLFKVLDSDHSLIPTLLPMTWQEAYGTDANISLPSPAEMQSAFERLGHAHLRRRRFCFFIDGLDEYSGKPADGVNFLRGLAMNSNIKIIVSSRPIPACVQYFSKQPKLYLQDLTYSDIETYVHQTVGSHPHMDTLRSSNLAQATQLGIDLVQKASGVFLWVVLACRSLLEGFANFDRWSDLQRRIDELPVELENLFQHMLCKVEVRYQADAAKFLKICHQNRIVPGVKRLSTLGLALVDDYDMDLTQTPAFPSMTNSEKHAKCSILDGRLRSRCCGLIEIRSYHDRVHDNCFCKDGYHPADSHDPLIDSTVEFMHRSVFDFLSTQSFVDLEIRIKDEAQESDANAVLACISMHLVSFSLGKIDQGRGYVRDLVMYSVHTEFVSYQSMAGIFARLQRVISNSGSTKLPLFVFDKIDKGVVSDLQRSDSYLGLLLATEAGIIHFLQAYEIGEKERLSKTSLTFPLLYYAVKQPLLTYLDVGRPHGLTQNESVIKYLLSVGCDPNESFERGSRKNTTPWEEFLYESDYHGTEHSYNTVDILLRGGADPEISNGLAKRLARKKQNAEILQCIQKYESELALRGDIEEVDHNDPVQAPHLAPTKGRHHDSLVQSSRSFPAFSSATGKKRARSLSPTNISKKTNFGRI